MKAAELVKFNAESLKAMSKVGIRTSDYKYVELWEEYRRMVSGGEKKCYAVAVLAERHAVSERTIKRIVGRFQQDI